MHKENREAARSRYKINSNSAKYTYIGVEYDWTTERLSSIVCVQHACRKLRPSANMWSKTKCAASVDLLRSKERQTPASAIFWHDRWREIADCKTRKLFPLFAAATRRWQNPQVLSVSHARVTKPPMDHFPKKSWMIYRWGRHYTSEALKPRLCLSFRCNKIAISLLSNYGEEPKVLSGGTSERGGWERDHSSSFYRVSLENIENHLKLKYQMVIKKLLIPKIMITQIMDTEIVGS